MQAVDKHVGSAFPAVHVLILASAAIVHNCTAECHLHHSKHNQRAGVTPAQVLDLYNLSI